MASGSAKGRKNLVIVESATKASTIQKYLNALPELKALGAFAVLASAGHVRQLPVKPKAEAGFRHGIREATWEPKFETDADKRSVVAKLCAAAEGATVWLASDPDREGEAIAWHLAKLLKLPVATVARVKYHEITKDALRAAFTRPGRIDMALVHAQMARQMLDRVVGYDLSPLVGAVVGPNASAGRVQSAALRLVVDRAEVLEGMDWSAGRKVGLGGTFGGMATVCQTPFATVDAVSAAVDALLAARPVDGTVLSADAAVERDHPPPPFCTSSMQQAAAKLRMSPKAAMKVAQALFEAGHITYMRTDSTSLSVEAVAALLARVRELYGDGAAHERHPKTRAANAQEAHEAIRPTVPQDAAGVGLEAGSDAARLYDLVYKRALATQMAPATYDAVAFVVEAGGAKWSGNARRLVTPGWKALYAGAEGEGEGEGEGGGFAAGRLKPGDKLRLEALAGQERLASAAAMLGEATLVKAMEREGIGRPSTYASTLDKLAERDYVRVGAFDGPQVSLESVAWKHPAEKALRKRAAAPAYAFKDVLVPTARGRAAVAYLKNKFTNLIDLAFTSSMETALDGIAAGTADHRAVLTEFARGFDPALAEARAEAPRMAAEGGGRAGDLTFPGGWNAFVGQYGPTLRGPPAVDGGKPRFVGLGHYLDATKKELAALTQADVDFMTSLPRPLGGGHAVATGRNGFYVTGPLVKGDLPPAVVAQGAAMTLSSIKAALAANLKFREFVLGSETWVARDGQYGPCLVGPPAEEGGKPRYVDLKFFLQNKGKTLATMTHDDARLMSCLPRDVSGHVLGVNQYGFYAKGPDGKYKTLPDDLADRIDELTTVDLTHIPFVPRGEGASGASGGRGGRGGGRGGGGGGGRGRGRGGRGGRGARAPRDEDPDDF